MAESESERGLTSEVQRVDSGSLVAILDQLVEKTNGKSVSIGDLLDSFGERSFGPLLLIPAIIAVAPTGAIPGMSIVTGTIILLVSLQILAGRDHAWLPERATSFSFEREKLKTTIEKAQPWAGWLENYLCSRWTFLVSRPAQLLIAATCSVLAASMFPLALLPFAVAVPGTAVGLFALGMTMRDGMLVAIGYAVAAIAFCLVWYAAF